MITRFETLAPTETLQRALAHVLAGFQHDFPVVEAGRVVGVLTRADLMKGLTRTGADTPVAAAMTSHFESAAPSEMLEGAVQRAGLGLSDRAGGARPRARRRPDDGERDRVSDGPLGVARQRSSGHAGGMSASRERSRF
jgi:CBS domain-containing protein